MTPLSFGQNVSKMNELLPQDILKSDCQIKAVVVGQRNPSKRFEIILLVNETAAPSKGAHFEGP